MDSGGDTAGHGDLLDRDQSPSGVWKRAAGRTTTPSGDGVGGRRGAFGRLAGSDRVSPRASAVEDGPRRLRAAFIRPGWKTNGTGPSPRWWIGRVRSGPRNLDDFASFGTSRDDATTAGACSWHRDRASASAVGSSAAASSTDDVGGMRHEDRRARSYLRDAANSTGGPGSRGEPQSPREHRADGRLRSTGRYGLVHGTRP